MSSGVLSLVVAVVGVLGTLGSSVWTQYLGQKAKTQEHASEVDRATTQYARDQAAKRYDELRSSYISLTVRSREFRDALNALYFALKGGSVSEEVRDQLELTRREYRATRAEALMIITDASLAASSALNWELSEAYGVLIRIDRGQALREGDSLDKAAAHVRKALEADWAMRGRMRRDLGVADEGTPRRN